MNMNIQISFFSLVLQVIMFEINKQVTTNLSASMLVNASFSNFTQPLKTEMQAYLYTTYTTLSYALFR